jgi:hypothetical protein
MSSLAELASNFKDELVARYRSPLIGPLLVAFLCIHWRVLVHCLYGPTTAASVIAIVEQEVTSTSLLLSIGVAIAYTLLMPWIELGLSKASSVGIARRNDQAYQEQQRQIARRKLIAARETELIETELKNARNRSTLQDIEQVKQYQSVLSGENFARWVNDLQQEIRHPHLESALANYIGRHDTVEGKFVDPDLEEAHKSTVQAMSTLASAIAQQRDSSDKPSTETMHKHGLAAVASQQAFRRLARERLGV